MLLKPKPIPTLMIYGHSKWGWGTQVQSNNARGLFRRRGELRRRGERVNDVTKQTDNDGEMMKM